MHESGFGDGSLRLRSWSVVKPFQKTSKIFPNWAQSSRIRITPEDADYPHFRPVPPRHGGEILFRGAEPVDLGRRAVALLCALTERPGAVVSKDALIEAAWSDVAVEESNLTVQISALRRALGGEGWIETLPRRGYRFVGPAVTPEENVGAATAAERRQLTVMSCELVGAAVQSGGMDLEEFWSVTGTYEGNVVDTAGRFGGVATRSRRYRNVRFAPIASEIRHRPCTQGQGAASIRGRAAVCTQVQAAEFIRVPEGRTPTRVLGVRALPA